MSSPQQEYPKYPFNEFHSLGRASVYYLPFSRLIRPTLFSSFSLLQHKYNKMACINNYIARKAATCKDSRKIAEDLKTVNSGKVVFFSFPGILFEASRARDAQKSTIITTNYFTLLKKYLLLPGCLFFAIITFF